MSLKIFSTLTQRKELFEPLEPGKVRMYVCGITAYDECHLGHARAAITFDAIYRYLRHLGFEVTYVRNFTDVDDKIINKANQSGLSFEAVSQKYIQSYTEVMRALGVLSPTLEPRASEHIAEMIALIRQLEEKGFAYPAGGDVLYPVRKFPGYGKLSHKKIDELEAGARVEVAPQKRDPLDFVLWKAAKPGEPKWPSPWGEGRPGWHIECSAMSLKHLGEAFDIHGGGRDLIFPHHENEIAQSEAVTGKTLVRFWIHNGFVNLGDEKMSKSLGNMRTVSGLLSRWSGEVLRYFLLLSHYRSPMSFTEESLAEAEAGLVRCYETIQRLIEMPPGGLAFPEMHLLSTFEKDMDDDFNATKFMGTLHLKMRRLNHWMDRNRQVDHFSRQHFLEELKKVSSVLGCLAEAPQSFLEGRKQSRLATARLAPPEVEAKLRDREQARREKNWDRADQIRQELSRCGIELRDNPDGSTTWSLA